ncbi:hypothetical protein CYMTET_52013 [Cymbomonas tetramitiformis]|uniref:Uncharacterized protein n=1 Tax=Cymbomonas tetramitiformis TaxID=36881 RepID=A0AAE0ERI1_9CHLO|nr:hypothetical protein CYMTET_52013 [Cymbomonas tetramitiformis]
MRASENIAEYDLSQRPSPVPVFALDKAPKSENESALREVDVAMEDNVRHENEVPVHIKGRFGDQGKSAEEIREVGDGEIVLEDRETWQPDIGDSDSDGGSPETHREEDWDMCNTVVVKADAQQTADSDRHMDTSGEGVRVGHQSSSAQVFTQEQAMTVSANNGVQNMQFYDIVTPGEAGSWNDGALKVSNIDLFEEYMKEKEEEYLKKLVENVGNSYFKRQEPRGNLMPAAMLGTGNNRPAETEFHLEWYHICSNTQCIDPACKLCACRKHWCKHGSATASPPPGQPYGKDFHYNFSFAMSEKFQEVEFNVKIQAWIPN